MVENALRSVVRDALSVTAERGLPGTHHFYVTFRTDFPGVAIPDFLRAQYPSEMTIVLEHQFWDLKVDDERFSVTLSFHSQAQRLVVPLAAITAFADPSVKFGLEFRAEQDSDTAAPAAKTAISPPLEPVAPTLPVRPAEIVKLDAFRKKQ